MTALKEPSASSAIQRKTRVSGRIVSGADAGNVLEARKSCHTFLSDKFGDRFAALVERPAKLIQTAMAAHGFDVDQAVNFLKQRLLDQDPTGAVAAVIWLDAAAYELGWQP